MHSSAMRIGGKFLENYWRDDMSTILEIGSYDVNGSLRTMQPRGSDWIGVDIEAGPGVDQVVEIGKPLPFADNSFDLVIATSVFEHDPSFWKTLADMSRLVKESGHIFITAPSNGMVHRFPIDCFRFYPDASVSFLNIIRETKAGASLTESFIGDQDHEGLWNDFVSIFSMSAAIAPLELVSNSEKHTNRWSKGEFHEETFSEVPEDRKNAEFFQSENIRLTAELEAIRQSKSWKITAPLRRIAKH